MVDLNYGFVLLITAGGGPTLSGSPFRLGISYQTRVLVPLPEVHAPRDTVPDISGSEDAQHLCENNVGKDEGSLGVPTPTENPPLFLCQYCRELAPYRS